jgi:hypothetical protein
MKRLYTRLIAVGLILGLGGFAVAQGPGGGFGRGGGRGMMMMGRGGAGGEGLALMLLANEKVREELALDEDQVSQLDKLREEAMAPPGDFNFREASEEERQKFTEQMAERTKSAIKKMEEILIPPQLDRLREIQIQQQGANALMAGFVADKLELTSDQKESLKKIAEEGQAKMREQMQGLFAGGGFDDTSREKMRETMEKFRKEQDDALLAVLTTDQKTAFEKMKGEPFDLPRGGMGFFGGGGRRGGPGGGPGGPGGPGRRRGGEGGGDN